MLPLSHRIAFAIFALIALAAGAWGFYRLLLRVRRGTHDADTRFNQPVRRLTYALKTTLFQSRTFRGRPTISIFHSFIFYGFIFYLLVNLLDAAEGDFGFDVTSSTTAGAVYNLAADVL